MQVKLIKTLKQWVTTHPHSEDVSWHLQNFLGDYFGWGSEEQKKVSKLLEEKSMKDNLIERAIHILYLAIDNNFDDVKEKRIRKAIAILSGHQDD